MAIRLIEVLVSQQAGNQVYQALQDETVLGVWQDELPGSKTLVRVLVTQEQSGSVVDQLEHGLKGMEDYRIIILPVEATIPRPQESEPSPQTGGKSQESGTSGGTHREELYTDVSATLGLSWKTYTLLVVLSSIVAAIGLLGDNVAVIIGAMVIAPLLGPNIALSLATTLMDRGLAIRAFKVSGVGILTALILAFAIGALLGADPTTPEIHGRTSVGLSEVVLALAAGSAGVLAFTTGAPVSVVGVMVAVALLPPLVSAGLLAGAGFWHLAAGAALLLGTNIICVNLAGVATFLIQGVHPRHQWEAQQARRASWLALAVWAGLLVVLVALILLSHAR